MWIFKFIVIIKKIIDRKTSPKKDTFREEITENSFTGVTEELLLSLYELR